MFKLFDGLKRFDHRFLGQILGFVDVVHENSRNAKNVRPVRPYEVVKSLRRLPLVQKSLVAAVCAAQTSKRRQTPKRFNLK